MNKTKKFTTIISMLVLCTLMLGMLTGCGSSKADPAADVAVPDWINSLSDEGIAAAKAIIANGKLVLGTSADYAPFEFHTEINGTDTIVGFDISIAQYMAEQLGVELEIVDMSFDNLLISLNKGDFDIVLAAMSSNEERAKAVDFSNEYYLSNNVILVQKQNADKYTTKESLQGVSMAAQKGTVCETRAKELAGESSVVSLVKVQDMVSELLSGKVKAVLLDKPVASGYVIMQDSLEMVDIGLVAEEGMSVAMKKDSAGLTELVNCMLSQLTEEQLDSWMGEAQVTAGVEE
ncbi:MAG: transporter substrate-binding domain-containing protein [Clostridiales bacterium]|nr:transporter substrate-binding domain-containing protein [Clostridiales bacterium]MDY4224611.1 transporter substrate-binding domain-containing protein [Candidatus Limivicinus sp.]